MVLIPCFLLAVASGAAVSSAATCPLDSLTVDGGSVAWAGFRVGERLVDIQEELGRPLGLEANELDAEKSAEVVVAGRRVSLSFRQDGVEWTLSGITLLRIERDNASCWSRVSLLSALKRKAKKERYLPSRHDPEKSEVSNEIPMYALDDANEVVALLKPLEGIIYIGRLDSLD
jgi:hypothetical protein